MDKYELLAAVIIILFFLPLSYLIFFISRCIYFSLKKHYSPKISKKAPVFGEIEYQFQWNYWHTKDHFICIEADELGPTELQQHFYINLKSDIEKYLEIARNYLMKELPELDLSRHKHFICIGKILNISDGRFSLEFGTDNSAIVYEVSFDKYEPVSYCIVD